MQEAMKFAQGIATPEMAQKFMEEDLNVEKIMAKIGTARGEDNVFAATRQ